MTLKRASIDMLFAVGGLAIIAALFLPAHKAPEAPVAAAPVEVAVQEVPKAASHVAVVPPRPSRAQLVDPLFSSGAEARDREANMQLLMAYSDANGPKATRHARYSFSPAKLGDHIFVRSNCDWSYRNGTAHAVSKQVCTKNQSGVANLNGPAALKVY